MRPYLVLMAVVLMAAFALAQQPVPYPGLCVVYGCGAYVPRLTTPEMSLQQFSPNPVGASNATTGLIAGATNSTLTEIQGSTSSVYTVAVWYQGGDASVITQQIHLWPETIGREGHVMHDAMRGPMREEHFNEVRSREERPREGREREEHGARQSEEARGDWTYITGPAAAGTSFKKAARSYNNEDVKRQNDKNGAVKYDGKTEKI
jgi:hypothetical protein